MSIADLECLCVSPPSPPSSSSSSLSLSYDLQWNPIYSAIKKAQNQEFRRQRISDNPHMANLLQSVDAIALTDKDVMEDEDLIPGLGMNMNEGMSEKLLLNYVCE
jgi:hypothetical protein